MSKAKLTVVIEFDEQKHVPNIFRKLAEMYKVRQVNGDDVSAFNLDWPTGPITLKETATRKRNG